VEIAEALEETITFFEDTLEDLIGIAFDRNYVNNRYVYLFVFVLLAIAAFMPPRGCDLPHRAPPGQRLRCPTRAAG
jgi:hypothetical protein